MTLATTCPECRTSFKVVPDQLKLHRGLVRCGRCQRVFSGIDFLTYLEADDSGAGNRAPDDAKAVDARLTDAASGQVSASVHRVGSADPAGPDTIVAAAVFRSARTVVDRGSPSGESTAPRPRRIDEPVASPGGQMPVEVAAKAAADIEAEPVTLASGHDPAPPWVSVDRPPDDQTPYDRPPDDQTPYDRTLYDQPPLHQTAVEHDPVDRETVDLTPGGEPKAETHAEAEDAPTTQADASRARFPWVAAAIIGVLLAALLAQAAIGWRNEITARAPALAAWFKQAGFETQAPRDRGALSIESFELRTLDIPGRLELLAVLRNRARYPVAEPAMELRLTDGSGAVVVRKVLRPGDLDDISGSAPRALPGRSEKPIRMMLELSGPAPSGYSVDLFYP